MARRNLSIGAAVCGALLLAFPAHAARRGDPGPMTGNWEVKFTSKLYEAISDKITTESAKTTMTVTDSSAGVESTLTANVQLELGLVSFVGKRVGRGFVMIATPAVGIGPPVPFYAVSGQLTISKGVAKTFVGEGCAMQDGEVSRLKATGKRPKATMQ